MGLLFAHACPLAQTYKWRVREFKEKELSEQLELSVITKVSYYSTGCPKKKYRCLITYIRKTRTVIALK